MPRPFKKGIACHGSMPVRPFSQVSFVDLYNDDVDTPEQMLKVAIRIEASLNDKKKINTPHYEINAISQQNQRRPQPNDICFNCKEKGHWAPNCPKPRQNWGQIGVPVGVGASITGETPDKISVIQITTIATTANNSNNNLRLFK